MDRPVEAELINIEWECSEILTDRAKEVISSLRTEHLNPEERMNLERVCANYDHMITYRTYVHR